MVSPSRMTSRWPAPASDATMASASVVSFPDTDSMSQISRVISMEDAARLSDGIWGTGFWGTLLI
jgi:hypothetical protein